MKKIRLSSKSDFKIHCLCGGHDPFDRALGRSVKIAQLGYWIMVLFNSVNG
jgi:hypothetical protein